MRSWYKIIESFDPSTGLFSVAPAPSSFNNPDQPDALALIIPKRDEFLAGLNFCFQFVRLDCYVPASNPADPPILAASMSPHEMLFGHVYRTDSWAKAVNSPWDMR